jgi:hypothetical protein
MPWKKRLNAGTSQAISLLLNLDVLKGKKTVEHAACPCNDRKWHAGDDSQTTIGKQARLAKQLVW